MFVHQKDYVESILEEFGMKNCKGRSFPLEANRDDKTGKLEETSNVGNQYIQIRRTQFSKAKFTGYVTLIARRLGDELIATSFSRRNDANKLTCDL